MAGLLESRRRRTSLHPRGLERFMKRGLNGAWDFGRLWNKLFQSLEDTNFFSLTAFITA